MILSIRNIWFLLLTCFLISSCQIETAKPPKKGQLVVASDYLAEEDTVLFRDFSRVNNISIKIVPLKINNIIGIIRNKGASTGIDVIMLKSLYDVHKLSRRKLLHRLNYSDCFEPKVKRFSSNKFDYIGIGIDPFIFATKNNKRSSLKTYNDLTRQPFIDALEKNEHTPFLSPVLGKMKKVQAYDWIKRYSNNSINVNEITDSIGVDYTILTTLSNYRNSVIKDSLYRDRTVVFPNNRTTGSFYNLRTICIIDQAENYSEANALIMFFMKKKHNKTLNKKLNSISIYNENAEFRKYNVSGEKLMTYYDIVDRILNKIEL